MNTTLPFRRRALRRALMALAGVAVLGACNTNDSLAPTTPGVPTSPSLTKAAGAANHATFVVMDKVNADTLGGAYFRILNSDNAWIVVQDNSALDLDPRPGVFDVIVGKGDQIKVCMTSSPPEHWFDNNAPTNCVVKSTQTKTTDFGRWLVPYYYSMYWWASVNGLPTSHGTYKVTGPNSYSMTVVNNGQNDLSPSATVYVKLPLLGVYPGSATYTVCQIVPPPGTKLAATPCVSATVKVGSPVLMPIFVNKPL